MKKIAIITFVIVSTFLLLFPQTGECRRGSKSLYHKFNVDEKDEVKIYVADITDSSGHGEADIPHLKKTLEDALVTRATINFKLMSTEEGADIVLRTDIMEFMWAEEDPIDEISGTLTIAWDILNKEHYARLQVDFVVIDAKTGKELWEDRVKATITSKTMTQEESIQMVNERVVKIFFRDCFSKLHSGARPGM